MVPLLYQQGERRQPADCYLNLQLKLTLIQNIPAKNK